MLLALPPFVKVLTAVVVFIAGVNLPREHTVAVWTAGSGFDLRVPSFRSAFAAGRRSVIVLRNEISLIVRPVHRPVRNQNQKLPRSWRNVTSPSLLHLSAVIYPVNNPFLNVVHHPPTPFQPSLFLHPDSQVHTANNKTAPPADSLPPPSKTTKGPPHQAVNDRKSHLLASAGWIAVALAAVLLRLLGFSSSQILRLWEKTDVAPGNRAEVAPPFSPTLFMDVRTGSIGSSSISGRWEELGVLPQPDPHVSLAGSSSGSLADLDGDTGPLVLEEASAQPTLPGDLSSVPEVAATTSATDASIDTTVSSPTLEATEDAPFVPLDSFPQDVNAENYVAAAQPTPLEASRRRSRIPRRSTPAALAPQRAENPRPEVIPPAATPAKVGGRKPIAGRKAGRAVGSPRKVPPVKVFAGPVRGGGKKETPGAAAQRLGAEKRALAQHGRQSLARSTARPTRLDAQGLGYGRAPLGTVTNWRGLVPGASFQLE